MSYVTETLSNLIHQTAFFNLTWGNYLMIAVACVFLYLAIKHGFILTHCVVKQEFQSCLGLGFLTVNKCIIATYSPHALQNLSEVFIQNRKLFSDIIKIYRLYPSVTGKHLETVERYPGSAELIHHGFQVVYDCDPFIHTGCYDEIRHSHPRLSRLA